MEHLGGILNSTKEECAALAKELHLATFDATSAAGVERLQRLATIRKANPNIVCKDLTPQEQGLYYQAIHDHVGAVALTLDDLKEPSKAPPFSYQYFWGPLSQAPHQVSPHAC